MLGCSNIFKKGVKTLYNLHSAECHMLFNSFKRKNFDVLYCLSSFNCRTYVLSVFYSHSVCEKAKSYIGMICEISTASNSGFHVIQSFMKQMQESYYTFFYKSHKTLYYVTFVSQMVFLLHGKYLILNHKQN